MGSGVKKIAQVAVGAVIGFVRGGPVGAAIGAGLAFYAASQQEKLNTKSPLLALCVCRWRRGGLNNGQWR